MDWFAFDLKLQLAKELEEKAIFIKKEAISDLYKKIPEILTKIESFLPEGNKLSLKDHNNENSLEVERNLSLFSLNYSCKSTQIVDEYNSSNFFKGLIVDENLMKVQYLMDSLYDVLFFVREDSRHKKIKYSIELTANANKTVVSLV